MPPVSRLACALFAFGAFLFSGCGASGNGVDDAGGQGGSGSVDTAPAVGPVAFRRLTSDQYASSVRDVLGSHIRVPDRIDADDRRSGLFAIGATFAGVSASGFERYEAAARDVAAQALAVEHRAAIMPCTPAFDTAADDACAASFVREIGRRIFRRALTEDEVAARVEIARVSANAFGDFHDGLELALASLLASPSFLFRIEVAEPDPSDPSRQRVTAHTIASRLSYLLWNTTPDDELIDAAESGALHDPDELRGQIDRLLASEKLEAGTRSFYTDVYDFVAFEQGLVTKDEELFPDFTQQLASDAKEQTLRTIVAHLAEDQDYRDLFTTRDTFVTPLLADAYGDSSGPGWQPYQFDADGPRSGILSHLSFMSLLAHPGRSSPTLRGQFVREVLLCDEVPTPPADIDFSIIEDVQGELRTARERLDAHVSNESCAGCHNLTDPIGLAFENFDAMGAYRLRENGATIDVSGQLDGVEYDDAVGLSQTLRDHPSLGPCLARTMFRYALGRDPTRAEWEFVDDLGTSFASAGFRVSALVEELVLSESFLQASGAREAELLEQER